MATISNKPNNPNKKPKMNDPLDDQLREEYDIDEQDEEEEIDIDANDPEFEELDQAAIITAETLPKGIPDVNSIIHHATIPQSGFTQLQIENAFSAHDIERLKLNPDNVTVPVALLLLFPDQFATLTKARKESRRKKILIHRGPLGEGEDMFDREKLVLVRVIDRVLPGDTLAIQTRMTHNYSECKNHDSEPPFHLPVVYEDDYFAIVNKPEGIVTFSHKHGGFGRQNVKSCLPWVLTPPEAGTISVMRRPSPVHRIDRGTSGLLICAKTKPAMVELGRMFRERKVKKSYTAIVNGDILEPKESSITSKVATDMGVCIGNDDTSNDSKEEASWQLIDEELEGQSAVTIWRAIRRWPLENARNGTVALVELKPKTGRYHQLRKHMALVSNCPLLGDKAYDGGGLARTLRDKGFYLCSNRVSLEHPYYNTPEGRKEWNAKKKTILGEIASGNGARITEEEQEDGTLLVLVHCEIDLPAKFSEF
eukprot:CAMPEP_0172327612 /NCGR_PEP_ID=MMETSP1058-20130122/59922_1 /TAXON_ID=83371 /ORGANISM="Detonula confervacea, Strain CCMP 353" /LENGTH=480 /DNA_ID=CAMNT_0013044693 /DNA_START=267 /DNA_END=1709 /DNA_ORIENTATION=-